MRSASLPIFGRSTARQRLWVLCAATLHPIRVESAPSRPVGAEVYRACTLFRVWVAVGVVTNFSFFQNQDLIIYS